MKMATNARKIVPDQDVRRRAKSSEQFSARRGPGAQAARLREIAPSEPTPSAGSAVGELVAELDRVKDELAAAQRRVSQLEARVDEDALLPVLNRRGFDRELERTLAYLKRHGTDVSLIYIDLDDFKSINDMHGHAAGDAALMHLAHILLANVRSSDVVGRVGGDEFAVLLHHAGEEAAMLKLERLARALAARSLVCEGKEIPLSFTAGVTQLRDADTASSAMARADRIMYAGKTRRRRA